MIKKLAAFFFVIALAACSNSGNIIGRWIEPVPGMPEMVQGFDLMDGGRAVSINMATLQYDTWRHSGDQLVLSGKSIGNHQTISFTETMTVKELTKDTLILNRDGRDVTYSRDGDCGGNSAGAWHWKYLE